MDRAVGLARAYLELSSYFGQSELPVRRRVRRVGCCPTIARERCVDRIRERLHASGGLLLGVQVEDSTLAVLACWRK